MKCYECDKCGEVIRGSCSGSIIADKPGKFRKWDLCEECWGYLTRQLHYETGKHVYVTSTSPGF